METPYNQDFSELEDDLLIVFLEKEIDEELDPLFEEYFGNSGVRSLTRSAANGKEGQDLYS